MVLVLLAAMVVGSAVPAAAFEYSEVIHEEGLTYVELESDEAYVLGPTYDAGEFSGSTGVVVVGEAYAFGQTIDEGSGGYSARPAEAGGLEAGGSTSDEFSAGDGGIDGNGAYGYTDDDERFGIVRLGEVCFGRCTSE